MDMEVSHESLKRLAEVAGIEAHYWDVRGKLHETTPDTMRALLGALGIAAGHEGEIADSLDLISQERWRRILPPVVIAREGADVEVPVRLPDREAGTLRWTVRLETGGLRTGECARDALPLGDFSTRGGVRVVMRGLRPGPLPVGYHELRIEAGEEASTRLIVAPAKCFLPPAFSVRHCWGLAAQLYALRSSGDWGIGDFGDLKALADRAAARHVDAIGLNPLHALFLDTPQDASPYSPSSRLFRNPLYLDVTAIADFSECDEARSFLQTPDMVQALGRLRAAPFVDYPSVAHVKLAVLERLYRHFAARHMGGERGAAFGAFAARDGARLQDFATFQALSERFQTHDWSRWPSAFQERSSGAVALFRQEHAERVAFFQYLQWQCEEQLRETAEVARDRGMAVGLYNDLAVSVSATSADRWSEPELFIAGARVGAPPDPFNETGQDWGVVALHPARLRAGAYSHFTALLRANMRHTGALRIDHVMGWQRLFLIPAGAPPTAGAYVRYPLEDFLAIAALESQRSRCLVIGEDLGTVASGFRERLAEAQILSCRVFYFEHACDRFRAPDEYPRLAAVSATTHDLPTIRGFWEGRDIAAKSQLGLFKSAEDESQMWTQRRAARRQLLEALAREHLLMNGVSAADADRLEWSPALSAAIQSYLARSPSSLLMVQLDDLAGEAHQTNLPGSVTEYPNWRRRHARPLAELLSSPSLQHDADIISAERAK